MSYEAVNWAIAQDIPHSSAKFVLVVMAHHANRESWESWLSVAKLAQSTGQDRKTVMASIMRLQQSGFISDTGRRAGDTKQIPVFVLNSPKKGTAKKGSEEGDNGTENGTVELSQKRDSSENGTVPIFPINGTVFPLKQSQFSLETVPKTGYGTSKNIKSNTNKRAVAPKTGVREQLKSMGVEDSVANDWLTLRKAKRLPLTETALAGVKSEVEKAGISMNEALTICCTRGWAGFKAEWLDKQNGRINGHDTSVFG